MYNYEKKEVHCCYDKTKKECSNEVGFMKSASMLNGESTCALKFCQFMMKTMLYLINHDDTSG